ncbi:hypothetical protein M1555_00615 [Patescibacteria group bacterium]|nr:hypothetical protein [Patescibacteria group bacterium]
MKAPEKILHFAILVIILGGGLGLFWVLRGNPTAQFLVGAVTSVAYFLWGIIHHAARGDLHRKVVIEYMLVSALAIVLLSTVLRI